MGMILQQTDILLYSRDFFLLVEYSDIGRQTFGNS